MENNNKYKRGSEWRKWDLHVHTASSYDYAYNANDTDNVLAQALINNEFAAVAITDHFIIDKTRIENLRNLASNIVFFPGVELRTDKGDTNIHIILIFSDTMNLDILVEDFNVFKRNKAKNPDDNSKIYWDFNDIIEFAQNHEALISIHAGNKTSGVDDKISNSLEHNQAVKQEFADNIHIFEMGKVQDLNDYRSKVFPTIGTKPMIICSDNHDARSFTLKTNCWIKADPTFEGLKQIIYEPDERVRIQELNPNDKKGYQVIDKVVLEEDTFWRNEILLNPNLNAIIGGRSTGKSTLLQTIAKKINNNIKLDNEIEKFIVSRLDGIDIYWQDGQENLSREIEFFKQNHMYNIANDDKQLSDLVKDIINHKENTALNNFDHFCNQNKNNISNQVNQLFTIQAEVKSKTKELKEKGDKKGVETEIGQISNKIKIINATNQMTEEETISYNAFQQELTQKESDISAIEKDIELINNLKNIGIIQDDVVYKFGLLSDSSKTNITELFNNLKVETNNKWQLLLDNQILLLTSKKGEIEKRISEIKLDLIFRKGIDCLQNNKELKDYNGKLEDERKKLNLIIEIEKQKKVLQEQVAGLMQEIIKNHKLYFSKSQEIVTNVQYEFEGVSIKSTMSCKNDELKSFLEGKHNLRGYDRQGYCKEVSDNYENNIEETVKKYISDALVGNIEYKGWNDTTNVVNAFLSTNWFDIKYDLNYQEDSFVNMSPGKKAFVVLKLLLEFSDKKCPILIDQPEDSLDNRAIYNELVDYIKKKKKERQIILVTHNSNVVVGADAELVIVANQHGNGTENTDSYKFEYTSGSLENTKQKDTTNKTILTSQGIREHVCEILEGGKDAFEKREQKYGFK